MSDRIDKILAGLATEENGCKIWPFKPRARYAKGWVNGREQKMSRYVLERRLGRSLLPKMCALHSCDNPMCVAEDHLSEGTNKRNTDEMIARGRAPWQTGRLVTPLCQGEKSGHARVTESQIREIRERYARGGITQKDLGREYGLSQCHVSSIVHRHAWSHVS